MKNECRVMIGVCALVIGMYACMAQSGVLELLAPSAADSSYNLLVQGFRAGQLSLKKEAPPALAELADPYDPAANGRPSWSFDLSYYKGRLYLYFGVTPVLILFWPFAVLTGHYLLQRQAVAIFCGLGFLASVGLLRALWRRYFAEVSVGVVMACVLALGLATGVPVLLARSAVWEVPISCGYMFTMLALGAIWCAMHEPERRCRWLVAASAAYGLAVGARPSLLFGAVILLMPMALAWREGRRTGAPLLAAIVPILLIGLGLMVYNELRFDSPFEFGLHYQLSDERRIARQFFSVHHLWFNFRMYFLEPTQWKARFPFMQGIVVPPIPPDHGDVEHPFGVLTNVPLVWLALAAPLAWRDRSEQAGRVLRWFVTAVALLFGIEALTLGLYYCTASRFEVEFLPELLLLAVVGILGLERALAPRPTSEPGLAGRPWWLCAVRCGWSVLLGFSVMFNLSAGVGYYAEVQTDLGNVLLQAGNISEAFAHYQQALRIHPSFAGAHEGMGMALAQVGRLPDAIQQYEQALRSSPDYVEARLNLGNALLRTGKVQEAVEQYGQALRINPDYAEAHGNLGAIYQRMGKLPEAVEQYEQALRSKPDYVEAHFNLGLTLEKLGRTPEAIEQFKLALKFRPDFAPAKNALTRLGVGQ